MKRLIYFIALVVSIAFLLSCSTENTPVYTLSVTAEPSGSGTVSPAGGEYGEGEQIELSATAHKHWIFTGWQGDYTGSSSPASITMDSDKQIQAIFTKQDYPLTIETLGEGTVQQQVVEQKTTDYPHGTAVELTAEPASGWVFSEWEGDAESEENPLVITVEEEMTITAVFVKREYPLTITIVGEGEVDERVVQAKTTDYPAGTQVELIPAPEENWVFSKWSGDAEGEENPLVITIDEPMEITATFLQSYTLTTIAEPGEGGEVTPGSGGYIQDTTFEVEAVANQGWRFVNWEGDFSGSTNPFSLTMNESKTLTANFERIDYPLNITVEGEGTVEETYTQPKSSEYPFESVVELTPVPEDGWLFTEWSGDIKGSEVPGLLTMDEEKSVTAHFSPTFYLAENGVTIMCPNASVGETGIVDGIEYEAVDRNLLITRRDQDADLTRVCTSLVTDMSEVFKDMYEFNQDIGNWDVSNVKNMSRMFDNAYNFNQDIDSWDVSRVTNMNRMFLFADFNQPLGDWDVSNVTDMSGMFIGSGFNQPIGDWDVGNVTDMSEMFKSSDKQNEFNQPIGDWDVSNVTDMSKMFAGNFSVHHNAYSGSIFDQSLASWDVSNAEDMSGMFAGSNFNQPIEDWDVSNVTNMSWMFQGSSFNQTIGNWDVSSVTNMGDMFRGSEFNQDIGGWNVSNVTDMRRMFAIDLEEIIYVNDGPQEGHSSTPFNQYIGDWDVSNVNNMVGMFLGAAFNQSIEDWDVSNVTNMSMMFGFSLFDQPIGNWEVGNVTDMSRMFQASSFNQPIGDWDVSNVEDMSFMFSTSLFFDQSIGDWDVSNVTDMSGMFSGTNIFHPDGTNVFNQDISSWDVSGVKNMSNMFSRSAFNQDIGDWNVSSVTNMYQMFKNGHDFNQDLSGWCVININSKPDGFDENTPEWVLPKPIWGTCPD